MAQTSVRYIVDDVDAAIPFYTDLLDFKVDMHPGPGFASLSRGDLRLLLNKPGGGGIFHFADRPSLDDRRARPRPAFFA